MAKEKPVFITLRGEVIHLSRLGSRSQRWLRVTRRMFEGGVRHNDFVRRIQNPKGAMMRGKFWIDKQIGHSILCRVCFDLLLRVELREGHVTLDPNHKLEGTGFKP